MARSIVIMAGGTGGHVFPALAVAQALIGEGWRVSWLGTRKGLESKVVPAAGITVDWLSVAGVRGKGRLAKLTAAGRLAAACVQALRVLHRRKPDLVLGMGGFVAAPGGLMAKCLGIPLIIHEQNRVPGTTNRLLARMADQVLEAFPGSFNASVRARCTGNPLREALAKTSAKPPRNPGAAVRIFVVGGSQGAKVLNEIVPKALAGLKNIEVKHQTGSAMRAEVEAAYRTGGVKAEVYEFIADMKAVYNWADLAVCRAGAMTVSELAVMGLPSVLIPLPGAIDDHQAANARYLAEAGAGIILPQPQLNEAALAAAVEAAVPRLEAMSRAARQCARPDATAAVVDHCLARIKP